MNIENIEPELIVLIVGILVATLIIIICIQGNSKRRKSQKKDLEILQTARQDGSGAETIEELNIHRESAFLANTAYVMQILIGFAFLIGFSYWTYYLIQKGFPWWGISTGIFALIGAVMPMNVWSEIINRKANKLKILTEIEQLRSSSGRGAAEAPVQAPKEIIDTAVQTEQPAATETAESPASQPAAVVQQYTAPAVTIKPAAADARWPDLADMLNYFTERDMGGQIPEDSSLRRHFVTSLYADIESEFGGRPTDSALRRHYDARVDAEIENRLSVTGKAVTIGQETVEQVAPVQAAVAVADVAEQISTPAQQEPIIKEEKPQMRSEDKMKIPEDSVLRRHFITNLRATVEADLPGRPTDSALRRHYDAMVAARIDDMVAQ